MPLTKVDLYIIRKIEQEHGVDIIVDEEPRKEYALTIPDVAPPTLDSWDIHDWISKAMKPDIPKHYRQNPSRSQAKIRKSRRQGGRKK